MKVDSIIFDLDGTLWDSTDGVVKAWNKVLQSYEDPDLLVTKEAIEKVMGLHIKEIGKRLFPDLNEEKQDSLIQACCHEECSYLSKTGGRLYEGLEAVLNKLSQSYKLFIVSNCQCGYIEAFFEAHKLDKYFSDYENPGRTGLSKGENIKLIIERNKLKASVYVGDTEGDLIASKNAGIPFVYAAYGFGTVKEYDYKINNIYELLYLIK